MPVKFAADPFHLSYPYVFKADGEYYLIPERFKDNSTSLYRADEFPIQWSYIKTLNQERDYVDNSIVFYNDKWWIFSSVTSNDTLDLHYADSLTGPWKEHPQSPIVVGDIHKSRPSGRVVVYDGQLYRFTMNIDPPVGTHQVMAYEIIEIIPTHYSERLAQTAPVLMAGGSGWNAQAMHQLDPVQMDENSWIASVDGFGDYWLFSWHNRSVERCHMTNFMKNQRVSIPRCVSATLNVYWQGENRAQASIEFSEPGFIVIRYRILIPQPFHTN